MSDLRLVIFDVDGTLIDSHAEITRAMDLAFATLDLTVPSREEILGIVGLSLDRAFEVLCPDRSVTERARLAAAYRDGFGGLRTEGREFAPLYPGARDAIRHLAGQDHTLLAVATGKSRRGLDKVLSHHGLTGCFHSEQVADHHPSKPDPSMILTALNETGVAPHRAVMVGDTTFDMDMARAAGVPKIGVSWGYHAAEVLRPDRLISCFSELPKVIDDLIGS